MRHGLDRVAVHEDAVARTLTHPPDHLRDRLEDTGLVVGRHDAHDGEGLGLRVQHGVERVEVEHAVTRDRHDQPSRPVT